MKSEADGFLADRAIGSSPTVVLPFALSRIAGGLPEKWGTGSTNELCGSARNLDGATREFNDARSVALAALSNAIWSSAPEARSLLLECRRRIGGGRSALQRSVDALQGRRLEAVGRTLDRYEEARSELLAARARRTAAYERAVEQARQDLIPVVDAGLQRALQLSSDWLAKSVGDGLSARLSGRRAKRLGPALTKYVSRYCKKTTPLGHFAVVQELKFEGSGPVELPQVAPPLEDRRVRVKLSGSTFSLLRGALLRLEERACLRVRPNPTLERGDDGLSFLGREGLETALRSIAPNEALDFVMQRLECDEPHNPESLTAHLEACTGLERSDCLAFVELLLDCGVLEWDFGISALSKEWPRVAEGVACSLGEPALELGRAIATLRRVADSFGSASLDARAELLDSACQAVNEIASDAPGGRGTTREYVLVEDAYGPPIRTGPGNLASIAEVLSRVTRNLRLFSADLGFQLLAEQTFERVYGPAESPRFLDYFQELAKDIGRLEGASREERLSGLESYRLVRNARARWYEAFDELLMSQYRVDCEETVEISEAMVAEATERSACGLRAPHHWSSQAAFLQRDEDNVNVGSQRWVVNRVWPGFGRAYTRFADELSLEFRKELCDFSARYFPDVAVAELTEQFSNTANQHRSLCQFQLDLPFAHRLDGAASLISLLDLEVRRLPSGQLVLWHAKLQKEVLVFELGLLSPSLHSLLVKTLSLFRPSLQAGLEPVKRGLIKHFLRRRKGTSLEGEVPRAILDGLLIVLRRCWVRDVSFFERADGDSEEDVFWRVRRRVQEGSLPREFFVSRADELDVKLAERVPPFYVNVEQPLLVQCATSLLEQTRGQILLSEALPRAQGVAPSEIVVQWYEAPPLGN